MTVKTRDLPGARLRRWVYHAIVGTIATWASWGAVTGSARAREASQTMAAARQKAEAARVAADGVAAECHLPPFSDEKSLRRFPMESPAYPTRRESECLRKVTQARSDLINVRFDLDKALPAVEETGAASRRRLMLAAATLIVFLAGLYAAEVHPAIRGSARGRSA